MIKFYGKKMTWQNEQERKRPKSIVLFDMDGTLTEPRESFDPILLPSLLELSKKADIGILTGSDLNYVNQQLKDLLNNKEMRTKIHLLPCNGTKYYAPPLVNTGNFELIHEANIKDQIGDQDFKQVMISLIEIQSELDFYSIPLTGHHISYRGSTINWCPSGRNANSDERQDFVMYDLSMNPTYRERLLKRLEDKFIMRGLAEKLTIKLGGSTSFDIYPNGWDKTYCLDHFVSWDIWFVGDKCEGQGNDKEIYDFLQTKKQSFKTKDPLNTKLIIDEIVLKI